MPQTSVRQLTILLTGSLSQAGVEVVNAQVKETGAMVGALREWSARSGLTERLILALRRQVVAGIQAAGGAGGPGCNGSGTPGALGQGGIGGDGNRSGGGGGGGFYGGGGGGGCLFGAGGGGGSSYSAGLNTSHTQGFQIGDGQVIITFSAATPCQTNPAATFAQFENEAASNYEPITSYPPLTQDSVPHTLVSFQHRTIPVTSFVRRSRGDVR